MDNTHAHTNTGFQSDIPPRRPENLHIYPQGGSSCQLTSDVWYKSERAQLLVVLPPPQLLNDQRVEIKTIKDRNKDLEERAKNKEEYNLRIQDEIMDLQDEFDRQMHIFPTHFVNMSKSLNANCAIS